MIVTAQRDLFGKRLRKPPPAPEFATHCMVADTLKLSIMPGWLWFHVPNGEYRSDRTAARLKRMGVRPGVSDFLLIAPPTGLVHALEIKRRGEKPSHLQKAFLGAVEAAGGMASYADTFDGAMAVLMGWGAVRLRL